MYTLYKIFNKNDNATTYNSSDYWRGYNVTGDPAYEI